MHDTVIRNAKIVDGTGEPGKKGDVAIDDGLISEVGVVDQNGYLEIDGTDLVLAPGWVDVHTHYDGQATWDPYLSPSCWHGVTTAVMGNCGVGFAPADPSKHDWLIGLMEGVEDIPGTALAEGIDWQWETFPEYLDALEKTPRAIDIAAQVPHGAVRVYCMGEKGAKDEEPTAAEMTRMADVVREGIAAGAVGFTTSRTILHRSIDGEVVPGTDADANELTAIAHAMKEAGHGVFEVASDLIPEAVELEWMDKIIRETHNKITYACVQNDLDPKQWERLLDHAHKTPGIFPQVAIRPPGCLMCLEGTHPFTGRPSYIALQNLPLQERVLALSNPETKRKILDEAGNRPNKLLTLLFMEGKAIKSPIQDYNRIYWLGDPPDYEPSPERSVAAIAERKGLTSEEAAYDLLLQDEGKGILFSPLFNYSAGNYDDALTMMKHPNTILGISDGGAHCGIICDAGAPSYLLQHFVRDRARGPKLSLEEAVKMQTRDTAELYGFLDRGLIKCGYRADLNLIDLNKLSISKPEMVYDLPANGPRLIQRAQGYRVTMVKGEITFKDGVSTGALPGKLIRGRQPQPAEKPKGKC